MKYILMCSCDSNDFEYNEDENVFVCKYCGNEYSEGLAGYHLLAEIG